jgi:flagellar biosynthesis chaperone FliJ
MSECEGKLFALERSRATALQNVVDSRGTGDYHADCASQLGELDALIDQARNDFVAAERALEQAQRQFAETLGIDQ